MKRCSDCLQVLNLNDFAFKNRSRGTRQSRCRSCASQLARLYYLRDPRPYKARAAARKPHTLGSTRRALREYLRSRPCLDCGAHDVAILELDHRGSKRNTVSDLVRRAASWTLISAEIAKCDVVCANCHRRRTARRFGWHKLIEPKLDLPSVPSRGSEAYESIKNYRNRVRRRYINRSKLAAYLREHPCTACGIADPVVLDFDHREAKIGSVAQLTNDRGWSIVFEEIQKCDVLCANCHRRKTAAKAGRDR